MALHENVWTVGKTAYLKQLLNLGALVKKKKKKKNWDTFRETWRLDGTFTNFTKFLANKYQLLSSGYSCLSRTRDKILISAPVPPSGAKQRYVLSPFLFFIAMDYILRQSSGSGVKFCSQNNIYLDFADDVVLLEEAKQRMQLLLDTIDEKAVKLGLIVNPSKTNSMATSDSLLTLECKDKAIEQVNEFKYLER